MRSIQSITSVVLAASVLLLAAGCNRNPDDKTAGEKLDSAIAQTKDDSQKAGDYIEQKTAEAGKAIDDAAITASVKTRLAADDELKALDITVDTSNGVVTMSGVAPTAAAKDRATEIAKVVDGVKDVKNKLSTQGS
jgi:osmotically-inducible protein OsmY